MVAVSCQALLTRVNTSTTAEFIRGTARVSHGDGVTADCHSPKSEPGALAPKGVGLQISRNHDGVSVLTHGDAAPVSIAAALLAPSPPIAMVLPLPLPATAPPNKSFSPVSPAGSRRTSCG